MQTFTGIFFNMYAIEPDLPFRVIRLNGDKTIPADRCGMLRYLVALGQVGVEIIFPGKIVFPNDLTVQSQAKLNSILDGLLIHHGQGARVSQGYGTDMGIGVIVKCRTIAAEQFALSKQLHVYFKTYDQFVFWVHHWRTKVGKRV